MTQIWDRINLPLKYLQISLSISCVPAHHIDSNFYDDVLFQLFIPGFIAVRVEHGMLHKVLKIKDLYISWRCSSMKQFGKCILLWTGWPTRAYISAISIWLYWRGRAFSVRYGISLFAERKPRKSRRSSCLTKNAKANAYVRVFSSKSVYIPFATRGILRFSHKCQKA